MASWNRRATALGGMRATTAAPMAGVSTRTVRKGKCEVDAISPTTSG